LRPKSHFTVLGMILLALICGAEAQQTWKAGEFQGLLTGKATRKDVLRVLGATEASKNARIEIYSYPNDGGKVVVEVNRQSGLVETIAQQYSPNITRTEASRRFGKDYREVRYSISPCPQTGAIPSVYRDPKGGIELLEYSGKGLVLWPNQYGFDIAAAVYRASPLPAKKQVCGKR